MTSIWYVKPDEVLYKLQNSGVQYPTRRRTGGLNVASINRGYAHATVIPLLYEYVQSQERLPDTTACARWLYDTHANEIEKAAYRKEVRWRTVKLVLDFYRELHTFGLLAAHDYFGLVRYAKVDDVNLGVDYTAEVSERHVSDLDKIGVQAAMGYGRAYDKSGYFQSLKARRKRLRNGASPAWDGPIHWLTNESRPAVYDRTSGVMLFSDQHVQDLVDEVSAASVVRTAVQASHEEVE